MGTKDFFNWDRHSTPRQDSSAAGEDGEIKTQSPCETRLEQAEARTEQAEVRTEQAKTRIAHAEARTEQAETRTEQAKTRSEQAELRSEQAEIRVDQVKRASQFNYRRLFEAAREGILILEADTGLISDVNPFLVALLGFPHDELVGKPIWELGPFRDIVSNKARFEQLQHEGYVLSENLPLETKDGRKLAVEFVSNVYQADDHNVIQCNVRDITVRQNAQDELRRFNVELEQRVGERTAQLQVANQELEAFSYSVSHDLRSPLLHIIGFIGILQRDLGPSLSGKDLGSLTRVSQGAKRMGQLIEDLLEFSRLGKSALQKTDVDLDKLVRETVEGFQAETEKKNIWWKVDMLPAVQGDYALLRMVLVNLISNAVKFTGKCAQASIEIGCVPGKDDETVVFIRDNGAGFDPEYGHKLFGVFQRLHGESDFTGTGIGLANVKRIIHRHSGRVWAEGAVGKGATFYFSLPVQNRNSHEE